MNKLRVTQKQTFTNRSHTHSGSSNGSSSSNLQSKGAPGPLNGFESQYPNEQFLNMERRFDGLEQSFLEVKALLSEILKPENRIVSKSLLLINEFAQLNDQVSTLKNMIKAASENRWPEIIKIHFKELLYVK